jgi:hypothetical protein
MRYSDGSLELCSIIFQVIVKERQYVQDLDFIESVRIYPHSSPPTARHWC